MNKAFVWVVARMEEPSTWAGTGILAFALSQAGIPTNLAQAILALGVAVGGVLAIVLPEKVPA